MVRRFQCGLCSRDATLPAQGCITDRYYVCRQCDYEDKSCSYCDQKFERRGESFGNLEMVVFGFSGLAIIGIVMIPVQFFVEGTISRGALITPIFVLFALGFSWIVSVRRRTAMRVHEEWVQRFPITRTLSAPGEDLPLHWYSNHDYLKSSQRKVIRDTVQASTSVLILILIAILFSKPGIEGITLMILMPLGFPFLYLMFKLNLRNLPQEIGIGPAGVVVRFNEIQLFLPWSKVERIDETREVRSRKLPAPGSFIIRSDEDLLLGSTTVEIKEALRAAFTTFHEEE